MLHSTADTTTASLGAVHTAVKTSFGVHCVPPSAPVVAPVNCTSPFPGAALHCACGAAAPATAVRQHTQLPIVAGLYRISPPVAMMSIGACTVAARATVGVCIESLDSSHLTIETLISVVLAHVAVFSPAVPQTTSPAAPVIAYATVGVPVPAAAHVAVRGGDTLDERQHSHSVADTFVAAVRAASPTACSAILDFSTAAVTATTVLVPSHSITDTALSLTSVHVALKSPDLPHRTDPVAPVVWGAIDTVVVPAAEHTAVGTVIPVAADRQHSQLVATP